MYLLNWSDTLWPRDPAGAATLPKAVAMLDHPAKKKKKGGRGHRKKGGLDRDHRGPTRSSSPAPCRGCGGRWPTSATYMIFDDHDVTDDWNLHGRWRNRVYRRPFGRRSCATG